MVASVPKFNIFNNNNNNNNNIINRLWRWEVKIRCRRVSRCPLFWAQNAAKSVLILARNNTPPPHYPRFITMIDIVAPSCSTGHTVKEQGPCIGGCQNVTCKI